MPVAEPYQEFAERWGNKEFGKYCQLLQQHADAALQQADEVSLARHVSTASHNACL